MKIYFSKRHEESLKSKKIKPMLSKKLRTSILRTLKNYSVMGGFDGMENISFYNTEETLKTFLGEKNLCAYNSKGDLAPSNVEGVIEKGYPVTVLDIIEAWFDTATTDNASKCENELNMVFEIHSAPWRIANYTLFLVDSDYIHNEIVSKTQSLMKENSFTGPLEEFSEAVSCLMKDETKDAVINAYKSVESVMKAILGIREHLKFGQLLERVIKSGILPEYYKEFAVHFEKLALGAVKERNKPGRGHGQGATPEYVPKSLAEFSVNLAAVINYFLIKRWIEKSPTVKKCT